MSLRKPPDTIPPGERPVFYVGYELPALPYDYDALEPVTDE